MSPEQKAALEWLDNVADDACRGATYVVKDETYARTLQAMLAEPRLPKEPEHAALIAMAEGGPSMETRYRTLYAHLTCKSVDQLDEIRRYGT